MLNGLNCLVLKSIETWDTFSVDKKIRMIFRLIVNSPWFSWISHVWWLVLWRIPPFCDASCEAPHLSLDVSQAICPRSGKLAGHHRRFVLNGSQWIYPLVHFVVKIAVKITQVTPGPPWSVQQCCRSIEAPGATRACWAAGWSWARIFGSVPVRFCWSIPEYMRLLPHFPMVSGAVSDLIFSYFLRENDHQLTGPFSPCWGREWLKGTWGRTARVRAFRLRTCPRASCACRSFCFCLDKSTYAKFPVYNWENFRSKQLEEIQRAMFDCRRVESLTGENHLAILVGKLQVALGKMFPFRWSTTTVHLTLANYR